MAHWAVGLVAEQSSGEVDAGLLMNALLALGLGEGGRAWKEAAAGTSDLRRV